MSKISELFGVSPESPDSDWARIINAQQCPFLKRKCYKVRKSNPEVSIGTCTVAYGGEPTIICPSRLIQGKQIFVDCLHLLTNHEPGNELHLTSEVAVPGGSIDFVLISAKNGKVKDFVGIELQTLDTTGTVWPERQRLLKELDIPRQDNAEDLKKAFGMNWKMTAKTILVQMHHKVQTFEHVNRKLVLVVQDIFLDYMTREFKFDHMKNPASVGDSMQLHAYKMTKLIDNNHSLSLKTRLSTDFEGVGVCLGLQAEAKIELELITSVLESRISPATIFQPI